MCIRDRRSCGGTDGATWRGGRRHVAGWPGVPRRGGRHPWGLSLIHILKTPSARSKIRSYFSKITRSDDMQMGRDMLVREMRKHGLGPVSYTHLDVYKRQW